MPKKDTAHMNVNSDNLESLRRQALHAVGLDAKVDASELLDKPWNGPSDVYTVDIEGCSVTDDAQRCTIYGAIRNGLASGKTHTGERLLATFFLGITKTGKRVGLQRLARQLRRLGIDCTYDRLEDLRPQLDKHLTGKTVQVAHSNDNGRGYPDDELLCWPAK